MAVRSAAVFLDKDGTLVENVPYNVDPDLVRLTPGAGEALAGLSRKGYRLIVVSNQSGVARNLFREEELEVVHDRLDALLKPYDVKLDGFYWCPHHPHGSVAALALDCNCRKPEPGMLLRAAEDLDVDLNASWMIGDILDDVEAGCRAGCRTILVGSGETEWLQGACRRPDFIAHGLPDATAYLLAQDSAPPGNSRWAQHSVESEGLA